MRLHRLETWEPTLDVRPGFLQKAVLIGHNSLRWN
jgi:hypothetical protein